ncbi:hypothetical protein PHYBOEH_011210 [Phytophthora boehmeriae]|uniref:THH1/TOM1/TOM3 domain-containing protein n=1 Tax=Phytophthora boehmeriae TaxID=109152 RepID=A0A8T1X3B4_9STRA|nr:hypothetical protein PHYBOEH_011210 [Phytophthora boehmeriae]
MLNITDSTCSYGLAQTEAGCVRALASYDPNGYRAYQIGYCVVGAASFIASAIMITRAFKHDGSKLQRYNFAFCCYASLTLIIRGADPSSYNHVIPRPISSLLSDTCTAALYSCYVLALGYWALIIQQGASVIDKPSRLKCLEMAAIVFIWVFYIVYSMLLFMYKGFNATGLSYLQLIVSAVVLGIICSVFLVYGLRVLSRLQEFERQKESRMPSMLTEHMMNRSFNLETLSDDEDGVPVVHAPKYVHRAPQTDHASKIRKILFVAVSLSLIVIAGQMYMAVVRTLNTPVELSCANGTLCDSVKCSLNVLHVLQVICIWVILWTFRDIQRREIRPHPFSAV